MENLEKEKILNKLDEVSKEQREINFYEVVTEMGFKHIKKTDIQSIVGRFIKMHPTYHAIRFVKNPEKNNPTESLFQTLRLTEFEYETEEEFLLETGNVHNIKNKLKRYRIIKGFSVKQLAILSDMHPAQINKIENMDSLESVDKEKLIKLAEILEISAEELI